METAKLWIFMLVAALITGAFSAFSYLQNVDRVNADLLDAKSRLAQIKESVVIRRMEWESMEKLKAKAVAAQASLFPLDTQKQELLKRGRTLELDFKFLVTSMRSSVERTRADAVGTVYAEVVLMNQRVLRNATIRKIEPDQVSFVHSEGVQKVVPDMLPAALQEKFDLGPESVVLGLEELHEKLNKAIGFK